MRGLRDESGSVVVFVAVSMTCLLGFLALATDVGTLFFTRRNAQTAADGAAVAAAREVNWTSYDGTTVTAAADAAAAQNGFTNGSNGVTVTVYNGPADGPHTGDANYVEVIVQKSQPTFFMRVLGRNSVLVTARAVGGPGSGAGCVYTLNPTGNDVQRIGNGDITLTNCTIYDDSSDSSDALTRTGAGSITASAVAIVGGYSQTGSGTISPTPITGVNPVGDPLAYLPEPTVPSSCAAAVSFTTGQDHSLTAGCYDGLTMSGSGTLNLGPGLYIINGNLNISGTGPVVGTGVTFYVTGSTTIVGSSGMDLAAPTSGTYNGILVFQARDDSQTMTFNGASGATVDGIFYGATAHMNFSGTGGAGVSNNSGIKTDFVVGSLSMNGNGTFSDYNALNGDSPLQAPGLVE